MRAPEARAATVAPRARPIWRWRCAWRPAARRRRPTVAALIPWNQVPWLQRLCYALPASALRGTRSRRWSAACWCARATSSRGFPSGRCSSSPRPTCWSRSGRGCGPRCRPRCWPSAWARPRATRSCFPIARAPPFRVPADALVALELRVLGALTPAIADRAVGGLARGTDRRAGRDREPPDGTDAAVGSAPVAPRGLTGAMRRFVSDFLLPVVRGGAAHVVASAGHERGPAHAATSCPDRRTTRWPIARGLPASRARGTSRPWLVPPPLDETSCAWAPRCTTCSRSGIPELGGARSRRADRVAAAALELASVGAARGRRARP